MNIKDGFPDVGIFASKLYGSRGCSVGQEEFLNTIVDLIQEQTSNLHEIVHSTSLVTKVKPHDGPGIRTVALPNTPLACCVVVGYEIEGAAAGDESVWT